MQNAEIDTSRWLEFGPMDQISIGTLTAKLDETGAEYEIQISEDGINSSIEKNKKIDLTQHSTFSGYADIYFVKTPLENALIIKQDLEKIGFKIKGQEAIPELEVVEFVCPNCDDIASAPGFCSHHGRKRLEFSDWVEFKNKKATGIGLNLKSGIYVALFGLMLYLYLFSK